MVKNLPVELTVVTPAGIAKPSAGIRTDVVGAIPTTSVWIPADGCATPAGVTSKFDV